MYLVMSRILVLAKLTPRSGNFTTAQRIKAYLVECGHTCELQDTIFFKRNESFHHYIAENTFHCVIGIHLWRAGRLLLDCSVPYSIIFGGTDLNEYVQDKKIFRVMTQAVENAKSVIAFSQTMADKAVGFWPNVRSKLIVQPQAIFTCPSENFTKIDMINKMKGTSDVVEWRVHNRQQVTANKKYSSWKTVAGLRPVKDPMFLFKIISDWHKEDSKVFLVVIGPEIDVEFSKIVKEIASRHPGVIVMSSLPQSDLHAVVKHSVMAVVNTSISEGMSASILEAMDLGTVVLARKIPGNECLIKHDENGLLFQTPEEFLSLAKQVVEDESFRNRLAFAGKQYVSSNHSPRLEKETYKSMVRTLVT